MAWQREYIGYRTLAGTVYDDKEPPENAPRYMSDVKVYAWNEEDPEEYRIFWVHHPNMFRTWDEVEYWVDVEFGEYGMDVAA